MKKERKYMKKWEKEAIERETKPSKMKASRIKAMMLSKRRGK